MKSPPGTQKRLFLGDLFHLFVYFETTEMGLIPHIFLEMFTIGIQKAGLFGICMLTCSQTVCQPRQLQVKALLSLKYSDQSSSRRDNFTSSFSISFIFSFLLTFFVLIKIKHGIE